MSETQQKLHKGQWVVLTSTKPTSNETERIANAMSGELIPDLQESGETTYRYYGLGIGAVGRVTDTFHSQDSFAEVLFGRSALNLGNEIKIDVPKEALTALNVISFFKLVLPGVFGLVASKIIDYPKQQVSSIRR